VFLFLLLGLPGRSGATPPANCAVQVPIPAPAGFEKLGFEYYRDANGAIHYRDVRKPSDFWLNYGRALFKAYEICGVGMAKGAGADLVGLGLLIVDLNTMQIYAFTGRDWRQSARFLSPMFQEMQIYGPGYAVRAIPAGIVGSFAEAGKDMGSGDPERVGRAGWRLLSALLPVKGAAAVSSTFRVTRTLEIGSVTADGAATARWGWALQGSLAGAGELGLGGVLILNRSFSGGPPDGGKPPSDGGSAQPADERGPLDDLDPKELDDVTDYADIVRGRRTTPISPAIERAIRGDLDLADNLLGDAVRPLPDKMRLLDKIQSNLAGRGCGSPTSPFHFAYRRFMQRRLTWELDEYYSWAAKAEPYHIWGRRLGGLKRRIQKEYGYGSAEGSRLVARVDELERTWSKLP
jgi:hypothetical protein